MSMKLLYTYLILIQLSSYLFANDTLYIKDNIAIINNITKYSSIEDIKLLNENSLFCGYLIIQIDSNSKIDNFQSGGEIFKTPVFWLENLDSIENDNSKFYFNPLFSIISDFERRYDNGKQR